MYSSAYGGIVYCYDTKTGDILWTYGNGGEGNSTNSGLETPFSHYPTFVNAIGNGVVYIVTTEHTPETPIFKGALARAINATTGKRKSGPFQIIPANSRPLVTRWQTDTTHGSMATTPKFTLSAKDQAPLPLQHHRQLSQRQQSGHTRHSNGCFHWHKAN